MKPSDEVAGCHHRATGWLSIGNASNVWDNCQSEGLVRSDLQSRTIFSGSGQCKE